MASIKQLDERRYKITVSNGYRPNGKKISKAKTIQVPPGVPRRGIGQYVAHAAEELERSFKTGYAEDGEMTFEEFASRWLKRQTKYAPSTIAAYRRMLEVVYPMIGGIRLNKLRPMALENMLSELRKRKHHGKRINESTAQRYLSVVSAVLSDAKRMASIRKRGSSYLIVVSMGYDYNGKRIKPRQKTVHPPEELTPRQAEKWLNEQAVLFERDCRHTPQPVQQLTLAKYIDLWLTDIAPGKLAKSTIRRDRQDIERILPALGHYQLTELRPEHFRSFYAELRKVIRPDTKKPLSEYTIEGVHATLCSILSDAVEGGFLSHNPAWRTYRYAGRKCEKKIADEETAQKIIAALEGESIKYETYFKLIIATGMRRGECCGLKWCDIDWEQRSIHICRNAVKVTDEEIFVKEPKTRAGDRYVYFSAEMESLLREYQKECRYITETYDQRQLTADDFLFRRQGAQLPMTPTTFTYRFKLILKKNGLPQELNVHSLRHTAASLMIAGGTDVATVAGILGHSQPSTTLDIYTHAFDKNKKAASAGLQGMLEI